MLDTYDRVEKTKALSLDERIEILRRLSPVSHSEWDNKYSKKLNKSLKAEGYEPIMFAQAFRLWLQGE